MCEVNLSIVAIVADDVRKEGLAGIAEAGPVAESRAIRMGYGSMAGTGAVSTST
jgi:hypothetical protein